MTTHRSWFPFILVGLTVALLAVVLVVRTPRQAGVSSSESTTVFPDPDAYETNVHRIYQTYLEDSNAQAAYDALIVLRVPSVDMQAAHLGLVIAFGQLAAGKTDEGAARLSVVLTTYPWIGGLSL